MTRLLLLAPLLLAACAATAPDDNKQAQEDGVTCRRETQVGTSIPKSHCRSNTQKAADRAAVDDMTQSIRNHPGQSPMANGK
ncbi:hypothetical protein [Roseateles sp. BYS96W]|uniref:Secreted protein n=1 Tax=Pelomonas nitida TaxID=3299027 RepID=A0ABW7G9Y7_9BURK